MTRHWQPPARPPKPEHGSEDRRRADLVKARAADLGFELAGVASAEPFDADLQRTLAWIQHGFQGEMGWITPDRTRTACNPETLLPGARSLVVVGASYGGPDLTPSAHPPSSESTGLRRCAPMGPLGKPPPHGLSGAERGEPGGQSRAGSPSPACGGGGRGVGGEPRGRIARYARGTDYHDVMKARLQELAGYIRTLGGDETSGGASVKTRVFVDSSPLPERAAAVRAGLGFVGKNTNLLTAKAGSWLLLGAVLTDLTLAPDPPVERDCGQCRLCLDACPTDAFPEPYMLDANRCISYLTIELRGPIPSDLRALMGDHVFGCDDCQDVCPWNRAERPPGWPEFRAMPDGGAPALRDLLALDDAAFRERYRRTPLWRTKRRGLLRNAAVALGNVGTEADLPALADALQDAEPLVRAHAAWAIGQIGGEEAHGLLERARTSEADPDVLAEVAQALAAWSS